MIQVYKFGGSSVKDVDGYLRVARIIEQHELGNLVVVLSAMGKTTNALEKVVSELFSAQTAKAQNLMENIRQSHLDVMYDLELADDQVRSFNQLYDQAWERLHGLEASYDALYDQLICLGELSSTLILEGLLQKKGLDVKRVDARELIATNDIHRDATVDWEITKKQVEVNLVPVLGKSSVVVTQGFIGGHNGVTTTLGREGSDYSAAILSYVLDVEALSIWKDVPGILTGDPREFENVLKIDRLSYAEAIEMTYYGAKVLHPKTIKPLQNKGITLRVRPFLTPEESGTVIMNVVEVAYPPIVVVEKGQCLLHIATKDFSFVAEHHMSIIFNMISRYRLKVNMMRNTAISFTVCLSHRGDRVSKLIKALRENFNVTMDDHLELITVRHAQESAISDMIGHRIVIFEERIKNTVQMVVRRSPGMKRKTHEIT